MEDIRQQDSRAPNAVVDPEMFPNGRRKSKHAGAIVAVIFAVFCAAGFLAMLAVT